MSAAGPESNNIIVTTLGSIDSFAGYARTTILPALEDMGLTGVLVSGDSGVSTRDDYDAYTQEVANGLDYFYEVLPDAAGLLIVNTLPHYATGMQTTQKEALRAHAGLWVVQAAAARALEVPRFAINLSNNPRDRVETLLRRQLGALGTIAIGVDFEKILETIDPPV